MLVAVVCLVDGLVDELAFFNTEAEAHSFAAEMRAEHFFDRVDVKAVSLPQEIRGIVRAEKTEDEEL